MSSLFTSIYKQDGRPSIHALAAASLATLWHSTAKNMEHRNPSFTTMQKNIYTESLPLYANKKRLPNT